MRRTRLAAAALAGAGITLAVAAPSPATPATTGSFTTLSYNVAGLPEQLSGSEPATNSPLISPLLNAYDVVLLQEDWVDVLGQHGLRDETTTDMPRTGYHDVIVSAADHAFQTTPHGAPPPAAATVDRLPTGPTLSGDGLNVLSRFPLHDVERVMWERCFGEVHVTAVEAVLDEADIHDDRIDGGSADCGAQKGFVVMTMELAPDVTVTLVDLHGDAGGGTSDREARSDNIRQLTDHLRSTEGPIIVGGDTNLRTGGPSARPQDVTAWTSLLDEIGLTDVCEVVDCGTTSGEIDKFAFRGSDEVQLIPQVRRWETDRFIRPDDDGDGVPEDLSDHPPVLVRWRWVHHRGRV